jgi:hypothetical protein
MLRDRIERAAKRELLGLSRILAILALASLALFLPRTSLAQAMTLMSFSSPPPGFPTVTISIASTGKLAGGLRITTLVDVKCGPFLPGTTSPPATTFTVEQVDGGIVSEASGSLSPIVVCDNAVHTYGATAFVNGGLPPLRPGTALAAVSFYGCGVDLAGQFVCLSKTTSRSIQLQ